MRTDLRSLFILVKQGKKGKKTTKKTKKAKENLKTFDS